MRELSALEEGSSVCAPPVIGPEAKRRGGNQAGQRVQWMHQGTRCRPGDASEFAVRKEGKEEHEEFLRG
jgi:hypothetical protein